MTSRKTLEDLGNLLRFLLRTERIVIEMTLTEHGGARPGGWFAASCCKRISTFRSVDHMARVSHFRTWAKENPDEARKRFPEAMPLLAESILT